MDYTDPVEVAKQLLAEEQEVVNEAETILDLDDEQDTRVKSPRSILTREPKEKLLRTKVPLR